MARKLSQQDPALSIDFFNSGWYTYRNPLFAPFKSYGVNLVQLHDSLIDGSNMEVSDKLQISRRAGFSIFCAQPLPDGEVVNEFYSSRNLNGTVLPWVDTTRRVALFSPTAITTVLNKSTTGQGYVTTIGNMTYISDGASIDLTKFDSTNLSAWGLAAPTTIPISTGLGFWQPDAHYSIGNTIQDTNGNVEVVSAILVPNGGIESPTAFTTLALGGGVGTWTGAIGPGGTVSDTLAAPGFTNYLFFESSGFAIPAGATILGVTVSLPKQIVGGTAVDQSVKLVIGGAAVGVEHASATPWSTSSLTSVTYGSLTDNWGGLTPAQANANGPSGFGVAISANILSTTFYSLVQSGTSTTLNSASTIYTFPNPVQLGNTSIVGVQCFHETFSAIHDSQGNSYTLAATSIDGELEMRVYVAPIGTSGPNTVTVTTIGIQFNTFTTINAHEFSGIISASPVETTGTNSSFPASSSSPFNSGTVNIINADDILFSFVYVDGAGGAAPAGFTTATNTSFSAAGAFQQVASAFRVPGATGGYSPSWSTGTVGITVALKSAESAKAIVGAGSPSLPIITIYYKLPSGSGPGFSGNTEPIWPNNISNSVNDAGIAWTNYGPADTWFPLTNYPTPVVILDTNGFLQLATSVPNPVQIWNIGTTYGVGAVVSFGGGFWISTTTGNVGIAPNSNYSVATTGGGGTVTTVSYWAVASNPVITGSVTPVWNTAVGGTTLDGSYTWTNIGQGSPLVVTGSAYVYGFRTIYGHLTTSSPFSNNTGAILGPLNGSISSFSITSNVVTFQGSNNFVIGNVFTVQGLTTGTYLNEQTFTVLSATPSFSFPLTSVAVSGSNVLTIQAINTLAAGQQVTFSAVGVATFLNGVTVTVLGAGLSGTQFEANFTHASYGPTADTGEVLLNGSWTASFTHTDVGNTSDAGVALPLISTITGTGTASPLCNSIATITGISISANIVTLTAVNNFQPGLWVTIAGLTRVPLLDGQQVQIIAVDQPVGTRNTQFQVFFELPNSTFVADSGTATFNAVEIYRTSDGGGSYLFDGAVTNPGAFLPWTFNDFVPDANLDILLVAPLSHQNDPPPGAPGSLITTRVGTITTYWNGRLWMAVGNYVYFDAGPDCTNGIPQESWPPGNRFLFAGPVLGLTPTPDGVGLLVQLADRYNAILGGPETISFYPTDALSNFGISNPNAIFKDGSTIGQFTTQQQYFELVGGQKQEISEHIADYLTTNFAASKSYVTMHRNGLDVGTFISNGVDRVVRFGSNIGAWSVPAFPVFGAGAMRSVETSVGIYSLMLASPAGGVTGTTAALNPTSGIGTGAGIAWANPSNITLGSTSSYATVTFASAGASQVLRASVYPLTSLPNTAVVQGIEVTVIGKSTTNITGGLTFTISPTNPVAGASSHISSFGVTNSIINFGGSIDTWGMPNWSIPNNLVNGALSFDIVANYTGGGAQEMFVAEVLVTITYQNPGNYLYARDINSWGDCGGYGLNNGTPYSLCEAVVGSITLSQPGARLFPLQHVVGYFDAVGTLNNGAPSQPDIWILPNEINSTAGIGFIQLPEVLQEPPIGQTNPSATLLALRYPVNMMNSSLASQYVHHLQVRIRWEPENAPNTIKSLAFLEDQST